MNTFVIRVISRKTRLVVTMYLVRASTEDLAMRKFIASVKATFFEEHEILCNDIAVEFEGRTLIQLPLTEL